MDDELRLGTIKSCDVPSFEHWTCVRDTTLGYDAPSQVDVTQKLRGREKEAKVVFIMHPIQGFRLKKCTILIEIKGREELPQLRKLCKILGKRVSWAYCEYHRDFSHENKDCF